MNQPDVNAANDLRSYLYGRGFYGTLSDYGIVPQSEKQAAQLLGMADKLRTLGQTAQVKQAAEGEDLLTAFDNFLNSQLTQLPADVDAGIKQAAAQAAADPSIFNAILTAKAAEAAALATGSA